MSQTSHNLIDREIPPSALRIPHSRRGISIIEVMTAVVVAMIGVFGTMALVPFAVKQANAGLELDEATNLARNAQASFSVRGFDQPENIAVGLTRVFAGDPDPLVTLTLNDPPTAPVMIDPVWINQNRNTAGSLDTNVGPNVAAGTTDNILNNFGFFGDGVLATDEDDANVGSRLTINTNPRTTATTYSFYGQVHPVLPAALRIQRVSAMSSVGVLAASEFFQASDDLNFSNFGADELSASGEPLGGRPFQLFDRDVAGNILKRQTDGGQLSYATFLIPSSGSFRRVMLVFADRVNQLYTAPVGTRPTNDTGFNLPTSIVNRRALMASAIVTTRGGGGPIGIQPAGGEVVLCPVDWDENNPPRPNQDFVDIVGDPVTPGVRRNDWVMMTNFLDGQQQIQFYRVVGVNEGDVDNAALPSLTLDGAPFKHAATPADYLMNPTYIIHLRDVVNVFEDTVSL